MDINKKEKKISFSVEISMLGSSQKGVVTAKNYCILLHRAKIKYDNILNISTNSDLSFTVHLLKPVLFVINNFTLSFNSHDDCKSLFDILTQKNIDSYLGDTAPSLDESREKETHANNIDNENTSGNFITKLWNNVNALYVTSAILFAISFIITAIINIGFILVELIGIAFVIIMAIYFNSWKFFSFEDFSKVLFVAIIIGLILMIFALIIEGPNVNIGWQEEWHECYKCNGSGKVKNDYGWNVTCPRCDGVGGLYY